MSDAGLFILLVCNEAVVALYGFCWWFDRSRIARVNEQLSIELEMTRRHLWNALAVLRDNKLDDPGAEGNWSYGINWERLPKSDDIRGEP